MRTIRVHQTMIEGARCSKQMMSLSRKDCSRSLEKVPRRAPRQMLATSPKMIGPSKETIEHLSRTTDGQSGGKRPDRLRDKILTTNLHINSFKVTCDRKHQKTRNLLSLLSGFQRLLCCQPLTTRKMSLRQHSSAINPRLQEFLVSGRRSPRRPSLDRRCSQIRCLQGNHRRDTLWHLGASTLHKGQLHRHRRCPF